MNEQFLLVFDSVLQTRQLLDKYDCIHVIMDESVSSKKREKVIEFLPQKAKIIKTVIAPCYATEKFAQNMLFHSEDFVIAVGKLHLQSLVKYYAFENQIDYALVPVEELAEYSFSKYAFLKDSKFCFYTCSKPKFALILDTFFSEENIFVLEKVLSYKNMVHYEKEFEKLILKQEVFDCSKLIKCINLCDGTKKSVIKLYGTVAALINNEKLSTILGAEWDILSLLCLNKQSIVDNLVAATNTLTRLYECMHKFDLFRVNINLNKYIFCLKKNYSFSMLDVSQIISSAKTEKEKQRITYHLKAYLPYLKNLINECKSRFMFSKIGIDSSQIESAMALCSCVNSKNNILKFFFEFGYFENLLK